MKLTFDQQQFDALICLNGLIPAQELFEQFAAVPLIAADGAANKLSDIGVGPEFIVGDLDSLTQETLETLWRLNNTYRRCGSRLHRLSRRAFALPRRNSMRTSL